MLIQEQFVQCPEQGRFNVRARGWPDSDHWMTPSPPELQLHQGSKRSSTAPMAPRHLLSRFYTFFFSQTHLSFFHFTCSVGLQPARSHAVLLHRSPPCVSFCFIANQICLQYLPLGSDLQVGKRQIDLVNKPDKFSPPNRTDLSVRRSLLLRCSVENMTTEQEPQVIRLNDSADRSR